MLWRFQSSDSKAYRCPITNPNHIPIPPWMLHHIINHYRYTGHTGPILDVQFSRTGSLIASSARDSTVRLWVPDLKGDSQVLQNLILPLPYYSHNHVYWLSWNSQELKAAAGQAAVRSVQFSPDNQKLLTASDDKAVKVFVFDCLDNYDSHLLLWLGGLNLIIFHAIGMGRGENEVHLLNDRAHKLG